MISCHQAGIFTVTFRDRIHCSGLEEEINDDRRSTRMTDGGRPNIATTIWRTVTDHEAGRMDRYGRQLQTCPRRRSISIVRYEANVFSAGANVDFNKTCRRLWNECNFFEKYDDVSLSMPVNCMHLPPW